MTNEPIRLFGAPGSPYTRKMLAVLRYWRQPYELLIGARDSFPGLPQPKVALIPVFYLPDARGEIEAVVDSTPLIRRLQAQRGAARSVLPEDPVLNFLDALIEDYGDEWLTKAMFHYRWHYRDDIEQAGDILPRWRSIDAPEPLMQQMKAEFSKRQIDRLYVVGSNAVTAPVIEASYARFLDVFDAMLTRRPFILGRRPGSADFGVYGQLTQLAKFDPTPQQLTLTKSPRTYAWVDLMDDLSGVSLDFTDADADVDAAGWLPRDALADALGPLLDEIGRTYAPVMLANARALNAGAQTVRTEVMGAVWEQQVFPYQGRCVAELRTRHARLDADDRAAVDALLAGTGIDTLLRPE